MKRAFTKIVTTGAAAAASGAVVSCSRSTAESKIKPASMHIGCQRGDVTKEELEFKARHGVYNIDGRAPNMIDGVGWDIADARRRNEMAAEYGISIDAYHLPLTSAGIDRVKVPHIMLGKDPERDREIEMIQQMISVAGQTGVRALCIIRRSCQSLERNARRAGGVTYSSLDLERLSTKARS